MKFFALSLLALTITGCAVGPDYRAPQPEPARLLQAERGDHDRSRFEAAWWQQFEDPTLDALVGEALAENRELRIAYARLRAARAIRDDVGNDRLPTVTAGARADIGKAQQPGFSEERVNAERYDLGLDMAWELDLFGATRARRDSTAQQLRSAEAQTVAARLAVAANTAQGYLQLRALQGQRALLVEGIEVARELERIAGLLFHAGEVTRLDVEATSAERASLEADLDELDIHLAEAQLALDTLLAEPPGSSAARLAASTAVPLAESRIAAGQPIDLLRRRPDLIAEAARLDAAELQALAARRDLFPKLAVQAAVGRSGFALGDAVSSASNFARVGATFGLPLDYANRGAAIELADAEGEGAYIAFEQALARALEEVERGLTRIAGQQRRHAALSRTREHRERAHRLAQRSYELGEANLSEVLDAQRGALQARQRALEGRTALATAQVALYVALGGGWNAADGAAVSEDQSAP